MNNITNLTRRDIFNILTNGIKMNDFAGQQIPYYNFWGVMTPVMFLKRLYQLDTLVSMDNRCKTAEDELIRHTVCFPDDYPNEWIFIDDRFPLKDGSDEDLLNFLCEIFNPEVRDETASWRYVLEKLDELITKDGYEFYVCGLISGREVYSWRMIKKRFSKISWNEVEDFLYLFEHGGYVLDFSKRTSFDDFTTKYVGIGLCEFYGLPMGKSLSKFTRKWDEDDVIKLLLALFNYYKQSNEYQRDKQNSNILAIIENCETSANKIKGDVTIVNEKVDEMKKAFNSGYLVN